MSFDVLCLRPEADFQRVGALPPAGLRVVYRDPADPDLPQLMKQAHALVIPAVGPKIPSEYFTGTSLQLVQVTGAGLDRLDRDTLQQLGVPVANVPSGSNSALADYAVAMAIVLLRRLGWADYEIREGHYKAARAQMVAENLLGLDGILVGVVGLGVIGLAVAQAFAKMGSRICYYDPAPRDLKAAKQIGAEALPLAELLRISDVVTLHVPLIPATQNLIGEVELASMKPGTVLLHASRGGIVDEHALARHLQSGHLAGAAVDVYTDEPPPLDHPLLKLEGEAARRVLLTPHIAGVTRQSQAFLCHSAWENVERVLIRKEEPRNRAY